MDQGYKKDLTINIGRYFLVPKNPNRIPRTRAVVTMVRSVSPSTVVMFGKNPCRAIVNTKTRVIFPIGVNFSSVSIWIRHYNLYVN